MSQINFTFKADLLAAALCSRPTFNREIKRLCKRDDCPFTWTTWSGKRRIHSTWADYVRENLCL